MKYNLSNTKVNNIGNAIREEKYLPKNESLEELQEFRTSHKESLSNIFNSLLQIKRDINNNAIITYRIKRIESIIEKLKRYPKMDLSRMWDIGGCRVIVKSIDEVYIYANEIKKKLSIRKDDYDYIVNPQPGGYKAYHIFVNSPIDNKVIEIQIRSLSQHNWATLVEISDLIYDSKIKEYGENKLLVKFHYLLSKEELILREKRELAKIIKKFRYIENLNSIFSRNYIEVRLQWLQIEIEYRHKFFLIETRKDKIPIIEAFDDFKKAEIAYYEKFIKNENANVVLTHLQKPKYEQISIAYSNYFLTMHSCLNDFFVLFEGLVIESIKKSNYFDYLKYLSQYQEISIRKYAHYVKESNVLNIIENSKFINKNNPKNLKRVTKKIKQKNKEWRESIKNDIKESNKNLKKLSTLVQEHRPKSKLAKLIFIKITNYTTKKYSRKYTKLLNQR